MPRARRSDDATWLAGVDGCSAGWIRVARNTRSGEVRVDLLRDVDEIASAPPRPRVVAIDMPIGLPDAHDRACDREARARLGARRSSVFPVPIRATLAAASYEEACRIGRAADGRGLSRQAWNLMPKIRALDALLAHAPEARATFHETHPEVCFAAWNDGEPMRAAKKHADGRRERRALAVAWLGEATIDAAESRWPRRSVAADDVLDAVAALWSAHRIHAGDAQCLPSDVQRDATGLPMRIVY